MQYLPTIFTIIADAKEKHLTFYGKSYIEDADPIDEAVVTRILHKTFTRSF